MIRNDEDLFAYLKALGNAYLINKVGRVDVNGLKKFEIGDKYFFEDLGLRNCRLGSFLQYEVYVGQKDNQEIDFVALKQGKKVYVQVAYLISDEKTREREFGNLMTIQDNYPKYVVSLDEFNRGSDVEGIIHLHLADFLKREVL
ncbi:ATP-binding protein [Parabacteroides faecis]|uniref:AAA+ superfamily ATPase n=1 Tax=Parabacteroides faecis TaxID=1217282 RepID=A0ABR6KKH4_9BACT|nr:ATP-binding protein [Parabacteroides faecis]MBB4622010.1 putative AAA+ superfamily ATPase [Parabacteroides faecis]GGJ82091.1 hypothetical protein GCM10007084_02310 [Parabacteroides faecis]